MGKKYTISNRTVLPITTEELAFLVEAYEGIKPSRAVATASGLKALAQVERDDRKDRPSNHKMSTDKRGRRPVVVREDWLHEDLGPHECSWENAWEDEILHHVGWVTVTVARCECDSYKVTPTNPEIYLSEEDHATLVWSIRRNRRPAKYVSESYEGDSPFKKLDK